MDYVLSVPLATRSRVMSDKLSLKLFLLVVMSIVVGAGIPVTIAIGMTQSSHALDAECTTDIECELLTGIPLEEAM